MDKLLGEEQKPPEKFPKSNHIELGSDGWLSPRGDYYKVTPTEHDESAVYLLKNSIEVQNLVRSKYESRFDRVEFDKKPDDREKLKRLGFALIRGAVFRSEDALNFTLEQLSKITEAGIRVVSAYEGSKEYSSKELIEKLNKIKDNLQRSQIINQVRSSLKGVPGESFRKRALDGIEDFIQDPLHKSIEIDEFYSHFLGYQENGHEVLPTEIFNIMSSGFSEEMVVNIGRYIRTYRVINLQGNEKLIIQRNAYHHGGQSRDISADTENNISMFVADPFTISDKFKRLIFAGVTGSDKDPKIELSKKDDYFAGIVTDLVLKP